MSCHNKKKKKKAVHQNLGFDMLICEIMFDPWKRSTDKEALLCWSHNVAPNTDMYANSSRWRPRQENWKCQLLPYLTHLSMFHELSLTILNKQRPVTLTLGPVFMWQLECKKAQADNPITCVWETMLSLLYLPFCSGGHVQRHWDSCADLSISMHAKCTT